MDREPTVQLVALGYELWAEGGIAFRVEHPGHAAPYSAVRWKSITRVCKTWDRASDVTFAGDLLVPCQIFQAAYLEWILWNQDENKENQDD